MAGDGSLAGTHPIQFPQGFAADGFQTTILGVAGGAGDNFALTTGGLASGASAPLAGSYEITLGISHDGGFLGTLAAVVSARVGGYGEIDEADGIPAGALSASLRVAAGYEGEVHRVAAGGADVELLAGVLPQRFAARGDGGALAFDLVEALGSLGSAVLTATVTQRQGDVFADVTVVVSVSALSAPVGLDLTLSSGRATLGATVTLLRIPEASNTYLDFAEHSDDSDSFTVDNDGTDRGAVVLSRSLGAGSEVGATVALYPGAFPELANFIGTVYYPLRLRVFGELTPAGAFPDDGGTLSYLAASGFEGTVAALGVLAESGVSLTFPQEARADFDARTDFGYDYEANELLRESPFPGDRGATVILTLLAERDGYIPVVTVSVAVEMSAFSFAGATATVPDGATGAVYDLNEIDFVFGAVLRREAGSSGSLALSEEGIVSATEALSPSGSRHTLVASAESSQFLGRASLSVVVEVADFPVRRGLRYQSHSGECSALGAGWRLPNLTEAAGFLFDSASGAVDVRAAKDVAASGLADDAAATLAMFPRGGGDAARLEGVGVEADFGARKANEGEVFAAGVRVGGLGDAEVYVSEEGDGTGRYCVFPADAGVYSQPADPAHLCLLTNGNIGECGAALQFPGAEAGAAVEVLVRAARLEIGGGAAHSGRVREDYEITLAGVEGGAGLFGAEARGAAAGGFLTVRISLLRDLAAGETASGTLRVEPETGLAREFAVLFDSAGLVRRGLRFQRLSPADVSAGESCDSLGSGWRLPNIAEAAGLFMGGSALTVYKRPRASIAGLGFGGSASGARVEFPGFGPDDAPDLDAAGLAILTDKFGLAARTGTAGAVALTRASEVGPVGRTEGLAAQVVDSPDVYCVRPNSQHYIQPTDPAGVCLLPDCEGSVLLESGAAGSGATVTLAAWRYDSSGAAATISEEFEIGLRHSAGAVLDLEFLTLAGDVVRGVLTVSLSPSVDIPAQGVADYLATPEVGIDARIRFETPAASYAPFGIRLREPGEVFDASYSETDYGGPIFPERTTQLEYLGARRGLHYVRSTGTLDDAYAFTVCERGGAGWRPPSIGELAGLFADASEGFLTVDEGRAYRFDDNILRGAREGTRIPLPGASSVEIPALSGEGAVLAHYADAIHNRPGNAVRNGALQAYRVLPDAGSGVRISLVWPSAEEDGAERRGVCVLPVSEAYQRPSRLARPKVYNPGAAGSAVFDRAVEGGGVFHEFLAAQVRHERNRSGPGFVDGRIDEALVVLLEGGAGVNFAAAVSERDGEGYRTVGLSQARPLVAGEYEATLAMPPVVGDVATSLAVAVSVPGWVPEELRVEGYVAEGRADSAGGGGEGLRFDSDAGGGAGGRCWG